ncbi:hypothetical protein SDC9_187381 [bioreactor metagenome]|uniref:Uncharacterized protein n=1 Tax=bioreactor metagenome TaxID=1076179 RepID=A0A645HLP8_9ZZZZ
MESCTSIKGTIPTTFKKGMRGLRISIRKPKEQEISLERSLIGCEGCLRQEALRPSIVSMHFMISRIELLKRYPSKA